MDFDSGSNEGDSEGQREDIFKSKPCASGGTAMSVGHGIK